MHDDNNFNIEKCGYYPGYRFKKEVCPQEYELQFIASGEVKLEFSGQVYELGAGSCWINLPGIFYRYFPLKPDGSWEHRFIVFSGSRCNFWKSQNLLPQTPCQVATKYDLARRIDKIIELSRLGTPLIRLDMENRMEQILICLKYNDQQPRDPQWLHEMLTMLDPRKNLFPDYHEFAKNFGMSRRTMFRKFHRYTGFTPHDYFLKEKTKIAMELLEVTDQPIKVIAEVLGYSDVYYFSKQFHQLTGHTPGEIRNNRIPTSNVTRN